MCDTHTHTHVNAHTYKTSRSISLLRRACTCAQPRAWQDISEHEHSSHDTHTHTHTPRLFTWQVASRSCTGDREKEVTGAPRRSTCDTQTHTDTHTHTHNDSVLLLLFFKGTGWKEACRYGLMRQQVCVRTCGHEMERCVCVCVHAPVYTVLRVCPRPLASRP